MTWDALTAIGSIAAAVILFIGSVAAVIQLRQLRIANQTESYLSLMQQFSSPEMVRARSYVESQDFSDPETLARQLREGIDERILAIGGFYQVISRLINYGILDRELFGGIINSAFTVWKSVRPIAYALRELHPENPKWVDLEYLVYITQRDKSLSRQANHYSRAFRERVGLAKFALQAQHMSAEAANTVQPCSAHANATN
jgi:hypothetical protein